MIQKNILFTVFLFLFFISSKSYGYIIEYSFTSLDPQTFGGHGLPVIGSVANDFTITNDTDSTWTDFHIQTSITGAFLTNSYSGPGTADFGDTNTVLGNEVSFDLDIFDLSIDSGGTLSFSLTTYNASEAGSLTGTFYTAYPTIDGNGGDNGNGGVGVPEPSILWLLGAGLGLLSFSRKMKA